MPKASLRDDAFHFWNDASVRLMDMDLKLVEAFALIMRAGSLTKAEGQTGMSKATLSRLLKRLEDELGVQLLKRSSRKITPTEAGRAFHAHCESLLSDVSGRLEAARHEVQEMGSGEKGRLRILSDNHFTTTFVCHVARVFLEKHPNIRCELDAAGREDSAPAIRCQEVAGLHCSAVSQHVRY